MSDRFAAFAADIHVFPQGTRTAQDAADAIGCEVGQICKSLVFRASAPSHPERPVLVVTSGSNRVDTERVGELLASRLRKADADYVRLQSGFSIGGVPPFAWRGAAPAPETLVDEDLLAYDVVWAAAGTPTEVFPIAPRELVERTGGQVARVAP